MREQSTKTAWLDQPDLGRLSERTLGGSSPPATCGDQITKDPAENEPQKFRGKSATLCPPAPHPASEQSVQEPHPSTSASSAASTARSAATSPSSAVRQASSASIRCSVDSAVDFRAGTAI